MNFLAAQVRTFWNVLQQAEQEPMGKSIERASGLGGIVCPMREMI